MIDAELKDKVLKYFCDRMRPDTASPFSTPIVLSDLGIDFIDFNAILKQFDRKGLISDLDLRRQICRFYITLESFDFCHLGGFVVEENVVRQSLDKLTLEVKQLKKNFPEKTELFTAILANIATVVAFFAK